MAEEARGRKRRGEMKKDPDAQAKQNMYARESYRRLKARLDANPVEKERDKKAVLERERARLTKPNALAKKAINDKKSYEAGKARLNANPVEKERRKKQKAQYGRDRRAKEMADPEAREKAQAKKRLAYIKYRDAKRARLEEKASSKQNE